MVYVILGAPSSGKGTRSRILSESLSIPHISTGDIIRGDNELYEKYKVEMETGGLIPDEAISASLLKRVKNPDAEKGFVLDGYPRTINQAYELEKILKEIGQDIEKVFLINVDDELIYDRVLNRKNCIECGKIYNKQTIKVTDGEHCKCGGKLAKRKDDTKEIVKSRIEEYESRIEKIVSYYKGKNVLYEINGNKDPEAILEGVK